MKDRISVSVTLNEDLYLISKWAYSWKMSFNPDHSKQATEIVFSKKRSEIRLPTLRFNNNTLTPTNSHKHLSMILASKLNFKNHLSEKISKANNSSNATFSQILNLGDLCKVKSSIKLVTACMKIYVPYFELKPGESQRSSPDKWIPSSDKIAISSSRDKRSNDKSMRIAPITPELSKHFCHLINLFKSEY